MRPSRKSRIDTNQNDLVDMYIEHGCSVESLAGVGKGVPDLLVGRDVKTLEVEWVDYANGHSELHVFVGRRRSIALGFAQSGDAKKRDAAKKRFEDELGVTTGKNYLVEVKNGANPPSARKLTPDQVPWHANWKGQKAIAKDIPEAKAAVGLEE